MPPPPRLLLPATATLFVALLALPASAQTGDTVAGDAGVPTGDAVPPDAPFAQQPSPGTPAPQPTRVAGAAQAFGPARGRNPGLRDDRRGSSTQLRSAGRSVLHRWIDLQAAFVDFRYRYIQTSRDLVTNDQLQHKQGLRIGVKLDPDGRYTVRTFTGTGNAFSSSWDNTGLGTGEANWPIAMRQFYFSAKPGRGLTGELGGMAQLKGQATEITTFDNDNYLVAYRGRVERPETIYLDEVSVTIGHVGDFGEANVFERLDRLNDHNYTQVLVGKRVSDRLAVTADWEELEGVSTLHQAVRVMTHGWHVLHGVRFEQYQRVEGATGYGLGLTLEKRLTRTVSVAGGFARIDGDHPPINGDRYGRGKRLFVDGTIALTPELTVNLYYNHALGNDFFLPNDQRFDVVASYDVRGALERAGAW